MTPQQLGITLTHCTEAYRVAEDKRGPALGIAACNSGVDLALLCDILGIQITVLHAWIFEGRPIPESLSKEVAELTKLIA